jgi:hypothetical protein
LAFEVADDTLEVGFVEDGFFLGGAKKESVAAEVVDLACDTLGVVVEGGEKSVREDRLLATGDTEMVFDIGGGLLEVKWLEMIADGDALAEGLEGGEAELVSQVGLADEDESEQGGRIHLVVKQKTELVEDVVGEQVSFVDDEENGAALAGQIGKSGAKLRQEAGEAEGRLGLEGEQDLVIEGGGGQVGIGEVDDSEEVAVEGMGEGAEGGRFAGPHVAGDEGGKPLLESKGQTTLDLLMATRREEVGARDGLVERGGAEAVEIIERSHRYRSPLVRVARSEWTRVVPG